MRSVLLTGCLLLTTAALANQTGVDYQTDQAVITQQHQAIVQATSGFNPNGLPHYTPNPSARGDYSGVTGDDSAITGQTQRALAKDPAGKTVVNAYATRPRITVHPDSPDFDTSHLAENDSYNITHGISDNYVDCQKHRSCQVVTTKHQCIKTQTILLHCQQTATAKTEQVPTQKTVTYSGALQSPHWTPNHTYGTIQLPEQGTVTGIAVTIDGLRRGSMTTYGYDSDFDAFVNGIPIGRDSHCNSTRCLFTPLHFQNTHLHLPVKGQLQLAFHIHCNVRNPGQFTTGNQCIWGVARQQTWRVTMQVKRTKTQGVVVWHQPVCP